MADGTLAGLVWSLDPMQGRTKAVRPQQGGILALARGSWRVQSGVSSFLNSGLGTSGGEVFQEQPKASGWQRLDSSTAMED